VTADLPIRRPARIPDYDYSTPGAYFVTVCTHQRIDYFDNPECERICREVWDETPEHFHVKLDRFVIMPDHVHFIIWICGDKALGGDFEAEEIDTVVNCTTGGIYAAPTGSADADCRGRIHASRPNMKSPNLSIVVQNFKSAVTRRIRAELEIGFGWQRSFYDHVIRNDNDLAKLRDYILNNPTALELGDQAD